MPSPTPPPVPYEPPRRRRAVFGLAAEAAAQAEVRRGGHASPGGASVQRAPANPYPPDSHLPVAHRGTCACGLPASAACVGGCGRPVCGEHLLNRSSRLGWVGPYQSEREHTAYLRAFWADAAPRCAWCREASGTAAMAALPPVAPLPGGALECLAFLLRHPHDYPKDTWEQTVRRHGGAAAVLRMLPSRVLERKVPQEFAGRRRGEHLSGVSVGGFSGTQTTYEVLDHTGTLWTVRPLSGAMLRKHRAWAWKPTDDDRVAQLLPRIVEMAAL